MRVETEHHKATPTTTPLKPERSVPPEHLDLVIQRFNAGQDLFTGKALKGVDRVEWELAYGNPDYDLIRPVEDEEQLAKVANFMSRID